MVNSKTEEKESFSLLRNGLNSIFDNRIVDAIVHTIGETAILNRENSEKVKNDFEQIIDKYDNFHFLNRNIITLTDKLYESGKYNSTICEAVNLYDEFSL